jgi:hypothetical protein
MKDSTRCLIAVSFLVLTTAGLATAEDAAGPAEAKPAPHKLMDHSPADGKAMRTMKDLKVETYTAGEASASNGPQPCERHRMMDHSAADGKAMRNMKDKEGKVHERGDCGRKHEHSGHHADGPGKK